MGSIRNMPKSKSGTPSPITDRQIVAAIERSGYPFEVELLNALEDAGLDPVNGIRLRVMEAETRAMRGDGDEPVSAVTREIDTMARVHATHVVPGLDEPAIGPVAALMLALIEAKSLPSTSAFVGFPVKRPSAIDLRAARARFAGAPCYGPIPHLNEAAGIAQEISGALDPFNDAPCCIQWALVEEVRQGEHRADHPTKWTSSIWNLVRAIHYHARANTEHLPDAEAVGDRGAHRPASQPRGRHGARLLRGQRHDR